MFLTNTEDCGLLACYLSGMIEIGLFRGQTQPTVHILIKVFANTTFSDISSGLIILAVVVVFFGCQTVQQDVDDKPHPIDPDQVDAYEIEVFREYLRIPSVHPNVDYSE